MMPKINVEFEIEDKKVDAFNEALRTFLESDTIVGARTDVDPTLRAPLQLFVRAMEEKLRKNDHKTAWRNLPVEALFKQMILEIEEYKLAVEFLPVAEARKELIDVANFSLIVWDRLSLVNQSEVLGMKP